MTGTSHAERARRAGHVQQRLRTRLRMYFVIFLVMLAVVTVDTYITATTPLLIGAGLVGGLAVGVVVSRMYRLDWNESATQVVSRIDKIGALVLGLYLLFAISRSWLRGHWVHAPALGPVSLSVVAGIMLGRVVGMSHGIRVVLRDAGVYWPAIEGDAKANS